ncbi:MAG: TatD family hydrolase [Muribaculaceae bacterium]|nr:TatD family hydrolase [Muribaculaceae bacterium]
MLIDTHTHLYLEEFAPDPSGAVTRAVNAGIATMIFPNVDLSTIRPMKALAAQFPGNVRMAMGFHPTEVNDGWRDSLSAIKDELDSGDAAYVAIGEIGMDLYWDKTYCSQQMQAFEQQVSWAVERSLPVIIHNRDSLPQTLEVLEGFRHDDVRGVFHSFGGTVDDIDRIRRVGDFYFGINGIVTFKNSNLGKALPAVGLDRMLLETDSPYLAPVPHRGRRNESAFMVHTAAHVADVMGLGISEVAEATSANARTLFRLS